MAFWFRVFKGFTVFVPIYVYKIITDAQAAGAGEEEHEVHGEVEVKH